MNGSLIESASIKGELPRLATAVLDAVGGHEMMAQAMVDDVNRIRHNKTIQLNDDKRERMVLSYHRLFINLLGKKDQYEIDTSEFAGVSDQELKLMLRQAALDNLQLDPEFRQQVMGILSQQNPDEARRMLGIEVLEPGYTEALDEPERPE